MGYVRPLIRPPFKDISKGRHLMPFSRVDALIQYASALLMIDGALSASSDGPNLQLSTRLMGQPLMHLPVRPPSQSN